MITMISVGQVYLHESGVEFEVRNITDSIVEFWTSEDIFVRMDPEDAAEDIQTGTLVRLEDLESEEGDEEE